MVWRPRSTTGFGEPSSFQDLGQSSLGGVQVLVVVRAQIVAEATGADREFVAAVASPGVAMLLGGSVARVAADGSAAPTPGHHDAKKVEYAVSQRKSPRIECFQEKTPVTAHASSLMSTFW